MKSTARRLSEDLYSGKNKIYLFGSAIPLTTFRRVRTIFVDYFSIITFVIANPVCLKQLIIVDNFSNTCMSA